MKKFKTIGQPLGERKVIKPIIEDEYMQIKRVGCRKYTSLEFGIFG